MTRVVDRGFEGTVREFADYLKVLGRWREVVVRIYTDDREEWVPAYAMKMPLGEVVFTQETPAPHRIE